MPLFMTTTKESCSTQLARFATIYDSFTPLECTSRCVSTWPRRVTENMLSDMDRWLIDRISQDYSPGGRVSRANPDTRLLNHVA